jgi:[acyl-carrier-protein] S-malonyltransferase
MTKIAIVFPGQASQYVGMGRDLFENYIEVRELYQFASDEIGEDMARLSFEGPAEKLKETHFTQPAILLHSLALLIIMKDNLPTAALTAGHSLGEYGSLALSGVLSFEDSLRAVIKRAFLMEEACRNNPGTMAAVMGLDDQKIEEICRAASLKGVVVPANFNSGNQIVISGAVSGVEEACILCKEAGAKRAMILQVGGAFHSPLMASAAPGLRAFLEALKFETPGIAIVPNVTAVAETNPDNLKKLLLEQITAPVRWQQTMQFFNNYGINEIIEIGPGKILTGLAKREMIDSKIINIDKLEDIDTFVEAKAN